MATLASKQMGRPPREPLEVVRTAIWYQRVRDLSRWTEYRLEVTFDEADRAARGMHKGSRWNKYRFGRASPSRALLLRVEASFPGTLIAYDHPMWAMARCRSIGPNELRSLVELLPAEIAGLLVDAGSPANSPFWMRETLDHRELIGSMLGLEKVVGLGHFGTVTGLLALIHDSINRQLEEQHFDCHVALAHAASHAYRSLGDAVYAWRLESYVFGRWIQTEYRSRRLREIVEEMRALDSGPAAPWVPRQSRLALGAFNARRHAGAELEKLGFWVGQKLAGLAIEIGLAR